MRRRECGASERSQGMRRAALGGLLLVGAACHQTAAVSTARADQRLMAAADLQALPVQTADRRLAYGDDPNQYGELRLPAGSGPHPVVVLVHGGCWRASYATLRDLGPMGDALRADGIASWNIEYRRMPQPGSGWPGTYLDVGRALDHLRSMATTYQLDLTRVVVLGHSAGGHLAMWAATRPQIGPDSALFLPNPLPVRGVMNLAGTIDMADNIAHMDAACHVSTVSAFLGGAPAAVPERYREVSAINRLPLGIPQVLVWGTQESFIPEAIVQKYVRGARQAGDDVRLLMPPGAGHFEIASPRSPAWIDVRSAIHTLLEWRR